jgi:hypothetical protein
MDYAGDIVLRKAPDSFVQFVFGNAECPFALEQPFPINGPDD